MNVKPLKHVSSTGIVGVGWDRINRRVLFQWESGVVWAYPSRGTFEVATMHRVKSVGRYYNKWFKGRKDAERLV